MQADLRALKSPCKGSTAETPFDNTSRSKIAATRLIEEHANQPCEITRMIKISR